MKKFSYTPYAGLILLVLVLGLGMFQTFEQPVTAQKALLQKSFNQKIGYPNNIIGATKDFIVAGHRGFPAVAPEDTLASFRKAIENHADFLEFDVQVSKDGTPIVIHDGTVDRTTNGYGLVKDKTLRQLQELDAGSKFNEQFQNEKIPTLEEVLSLAQMNAIPIFPEIKGYRSTQDISLILEKIIQYGFEDTSILQDFNFDDFETVRQYSKKIKLAYLIKDQEGFENALKSAKRLGNAYFFVERRFLINHPNLVQLAHDNAIGVIVWTVDDKESLETLMKLKVDGVITNNVVKIRQVLAAA